MYDALWQATYYARSAYYDYSSLYEDNFTPYEPSNGGNFTEKVLDYIYQYDMVSLGMALHPIMDVYSPAHAFKIWNGSYFAYIPHAFESVFIYYNEAEKPMVATLDIYCAIEYMDITGDMETDKYTVEEIFDNWIYGNIGPLNDENKK